MIWIYTFFSDGLKINMFFSKLESVSPNFLLFLKLPPSRLKLNFDNAKKVDIRSSSNSMTSDQ